MNGTSTLSLDGVYKNFGGLVAVDNLILKVMPGQICGLIGPNGAGKTTVFNMITGVYPCRQGSLLLEDVDITSMKSYRITRLGIARTFQTIRLFPNLSTLEHVMVGQNFLSQSNRERSFLPGGNQGNTLRDEAYEILNLLGLWEVRHQKAVNLPYGRQRRVEIARALATRPKLLLLDEPSAGMNIRETDDLLKTITRIHELGITILLIEHDMKVVMGICEYIFVLNFGEKIAEGPPEKIRRDEKVLEAYLGREE